MGRSPGSDGAPAGIIKRILSQFLSPSCFTTGLKKHTRTQKQTKKTPTTKKHDSIFKENVRGKKKSNNQQDKTNRGHLTGVNPQITSSSPGPGCLVPSQSHSLSLGADRSTLSLSRV